MKEEREITPEEAAQKFEEMDRRDREFEARRTWGEGTEGESEGRPFEKYT